MRRDCAPAAGVETKRILGLVGAVLLAGCIPYKTMEWRSIPLDQAELSPGSEKRLQVGDRVRAMKRDGKVYRYKVVELAQDGFWGTQKERFKFWIPYSSLKGLKVEREELEFFVVGFDLSPGPF